MILRKIYTYIYLKYIEERIRRFEKKIFNNKSLINTDIEKFKFSDYWEERINRIKWSPYNQKIPRVNHAGQVFGDYQLMHNGLFIKVGGYYGYPITKALFVNKGVHEPFEEYYFCKILSEIYNKAPVILELGAYWSFYSMWFLKEKDNSSAFMIEPIKENIKIGKLNFEYNNLKGNFFQYFIGEKSDAITISVDDFVINQNIGNIDILHADIQGDELKMLKGAENAIKNKIINYFFISTHSNYLHYQCLNFLESNGYYIIDHLDLDYSDCLDGIIIAKIID